MSATKRRTRDAAPARPGTLRSADPGDAGPTPPAGSAAQTGRHLVRVASSGVAYLVYWMVTLLLIGQAVASVLQPPQGSLGIGVLVGLVCLIWAAFCLAMGVLRGADQEGVDRPPPGWLPVITAVGCLISLAVVRMRTQLQGEPWTAELTAAALVVGAITVWLGMTAGAVSGVLLATLILVAPLLDGSSALLLHTPLTGTVTGVTLVVLGFAAALALGWLRRGAEQLQRSLDARDDLLVREQAVRTAAELAAEVERSLHDTALNTLETIAAHGEHLPPEAVVARCRSDVDQLSRWRSEAGLANITEVLDRLQSHADRIGLRLDVRVVLPSVVEPKPVPVPPPVLQAFCGAATEALTNVSKHAGTDEAIVLVLHDVASLQLLVTDEGVGPGKAASGFGLRGSVAGRMSAVGGTAVMTPGPDGLGTRVTLDWEPVPPELPQIASDLLIHVAAVGVGVATALAGVGCALVVIGWSAYVWPWPALLAPLLSVLVAAWLLDEARRGVRIGGWHVLAACATYVGVGTAAMVADPYCSSLLGERVILDARAPMIMVLLLLAPRPAVLASLLGTVIVTHGLGALEWRHLWPACGQSTTVTGVFVLASLAAIWLFARRIQKLSDDFSLARDEATQAEIRIRAQLTVRTEGELWVADTLTSAQELLEDLAEGRRPPADPLTRQECAAEARFLRSLLAVGRAAQGLRRPARFWLRQLHLAQCSVTVRGAFPPTPPPPDVVAQIGGVLDAVASLVPGSAVTMAVWSDQGSDSMMVTVTGPAVARSLEPLAERIGLIAGDALADLGEDSATMEWIWPRPAPPIPDPAR